MSASLNFSHWSEEEIENGEKLYRDGVILSQSPSRGAMFGTRSWLVFFPILLMMVRTDGHLRKSRAIGFTNGGRINIGVQFILPLTLTLPMVSGRWPRSTGGPGFSTADESDYSADPWHGGHLRKLDLYFHHLNIGEEQCRQRLLCEMAADPPQFHPLSELLLAKIIRENEVVKVESTLQRMRNYETAVSVGGGSTNETCEIRYNECDGGPTELLNLPLLRLWQNLADYLHINMLEELDT